MVMGTMDLSEFNVNVMTRNNGAHQRSPYGPGIQKQPFFLFQTQEMFFHLNETVIFKLYYIMSSIELIFSGVRNKKKGHF